MKTKLLDRQKAGITIETDVLVLTRNGFACTCPLVNRMLVPGAIQGQPQINPGLCTSNCTAFRLSVPVASNSYFFNCGAANTSEEILAENITDNSNPSKLTKL